MIMGANRRVEGMGRPDERTPVERLLDEKTDEGLDRSLSRRSTQYARSLEAYFRAGDPPRWMTRLSEIDRGIARETQRVERAYRALQAEHGDDRAAFARRWRERAHGFDFAELNELIEQHNEWYPIERRLPIDLRTRDYVLVAGRCYRRPVLGPDWVLSLFPA
jgi:hypothetical protein